MKNRRQRNARGRRGDDGCFDYKYAPRGAGQRGYRLANASFCGKFLRFSVHLTMKPSGTWCARILRWLLRLIPAAAEVRILRGPLRGMKWIKGAGPNAWVGTYEVARVQPLAQEVSRGALVYDIGANVGIYSLLASLRTGPSGMVCAFPPLERNLRYLRRHVAINRIDCARETRLVQSVVHRV